MAIIDVVKCTMGNRELVAKFPSDDLRQGTQVVVYPSQTAFFVKGGQIFDVFKEGTYTLDTNNIPLLNKILNLPFGGDSPFKAEVWYVNEIAVLNSKWGTATPLQIEDPKYGIILPVRGYGQYGFKVVEPRKLIETLVGNIATFSVDTVERYFRGKVLSRLTSIIHKKLVKEEISVLDINSHLEEISEYAKECLDEQFRRYGLSIQEFDAISINVNEDDESFKKLKEAKDINARLKITGRDVYQMERSFDVLENAAENSGGVAGTMMGAGMGLGMGVNAGAQMGGIINTNPQMAMAPPPLPTSPQYFIAPNGQQQGPLDLNIMAQFIQQGRINGDTLAWKAGMASWEKLSTFTEFNSYFNSDLVPPSLT